MSWQSDSEITTGLVLRGKLPFAFLDPSIFIAPYDVVIKKVKEAGEVNTSKLIEVAGLSPIQTALDAAEAVNGLEKADWASILKSSFVKNEVGTFLERTGRKLLQGKEIDISKLVEQVGRIADSKTSLTRMSDIIAGKVPFMQTGWRTWDYHFGGIPKIGLITVGAPPKTGKTTTLMKMATCFVKKHPEKVVAIFTIEMMSSEFKGRCLEVEPDLTEDHMNRILLCEDAVNVDEIANKIASIENIGLAAIDFADMMIEGDVDSNKMEHVYKVLTLLSKRVKIPIMLLAQLSSNYQGGVPKPMHLRWTRLAEALSWMLVMLYAPARDYFAEKDKMLVPVPGKSYLILWLCRGGFRKHDGPGAIQLAWSGKTGWADSKGRWFSLGAENVVGDDDD